MISELDIGRCASEEAELRRGVDMRRYDIKDAGPKMVDLVGVPHRWKKGTSASEEARPQRGMDCEIPHWLRRRTKHFVKVWKPLTSRRVLKTLRGSPKGKAQRGQYLLAIG